jgi:hypothetical protein
LTRVWFRGVRRLPAVSPPLLGLAAPVTGAALGWAVLDESLSPSPFVGFAITLARSRWAPRGRGRASPTHDRPSGAAHRRRSTGGAISRARGEPSQRVTNLAGHNNEAVCPVNRQS